MANQRSSSRFLSILIILGGIAVQSAAKPRDLSLYPLRVRILQSDWRANGSYGGQGSGVADLIDGQEIHGIEFAYNCQVNYLKSVGNQAYAAKWKKPNKTIEIVGSEVGSQNHSDTCEFRITLHDYVYDIQNGTVAIFTQDQYKVRIGLALPQTGSVDADISHYPVRLSILEINWAPPLNGTRTGTGRGNLRTPAGFSSVDFTTNCVVPFTASGETRYYPARWTQEGAALALLLRTVEPSKALSCTLKTNMHTDIYVLDPSGTIRAVSQEEYRRTKLNAVASPPQAASSTQAAPPPQ